MCAGGGGGLPSYKPYRYVLPQRVWYRTLIPDQNGPAKSIPVFRAKRRKKKTFGAVDAYVVYIREYPLESSLTPRTKLLARLNSSFSTLFPRRM